jgi:hypothetical protein
MKGHHGRPASHNFSRRAASTVCQIALTHGVILRNGSHPPRAAVIAPNPLPPRASPLALGLLTLTQSD